MGSYKHGNKPSGSIKKNFLTTWLLTSQEGPSFMELVG